MELGDFEQANEFEFDLSDVDVAAFESVATEDTVNSIQDQHMLPQHQPSHSIKTIQHSAPTQLLQAQQSAKQPQQIQHHVAHISQATGTPGGKILLVPINSKQGTTGLKHLFQLPAGTTPITMGTLTTSGNKKQIIQLTPLSASNLNMTKNNYQLLPGSSQGQKQQHIYLTTSSSPLKHQQTISLNSISNKSSSPLQSNSSNLTTNLPSTRNISHNDSLRTSTPSLNVANEVPKRKPCNCTKSQCLKLYCDCFANGEFCSGCNCTNCFNSLTKEKERQKAISQCLERNPEAFRPKIGKAIKHTVGEPAPDSIERRHTKGCNCKRSGCLKNYCECYEAKILCSNLCKCCGCKNYEESFERKSLMQLANSASENARGILKNLLPTHNNSNTGKEFTKCFITDKVIHASLMCLLQSAQQAEKDGTLSDDLPNLIQTEMGKCLQMIVDSATDTLSVT